MFVTELSDGLRALSCSACAGHWISHDNYRTWLRKHGEALPVRLGDPIEVDDPNPDRARVCPECSHLLLKYSVGQGLCFMIDHCSPCGGVWLDRNEWTALEARNLHDEMHRIFSMSWQRSVRGEQLRIRLGQHYHRRFGQQDFASLRAARKWIHEHPEKQAMLAFLDAEDPFAW